jgi:hypothetical protein
MTDGLDSYMANGVPGSWDGFLYTGSNHQSVGDANCVRNPTCWLTTAGADLTGIPARVGVGGWGAAVTPKHVLMANHIGVSVGTILRWIDNSGTVVTRTVDQTTFISGSNDILLCRLSVALPVSITPLKIFPANVTYINTVPGPVVILRQNGELSVFDLTDVNGISPPNNYAGWQPPVSMYRFIHNTPIIGGDSGYPVMAIVHGNLVLITTLFLATLGPSYSDYSAAIEALVAADGQTLSFATIP